MYNINAELKKIDGEMLRTANSLEKCEALLVIIDKKHIALVGQLEAKRLNSEQLQNVADFIFYLKFRRDLLAERIEQLKSVHPSRIDSLGQVIPWDTESSLLNWKRKV